MFDFDWFDNVRVECTIAPGFCQTKCNFLYIPSKSGVLSPVKQCTG